MSVLAAPAQQGYGADDAVRGEIDERLIDEVQAFDREGETQLAEQVHPLARGRGERGFKIERLAAVE